MSVEIIPSVLATTPAQLKNRAIIAQKLSPLIHLDVMDGKFVRTKSVSAKQLSQIKWTSKIEVHAMVKNPSSLLSVIEAVKPKRVYLHIELGDKLLPFIAFLRTRKIELSLAINPNTKIQKLKPFVNFTKSVLVMSVHPGKYHAPYLKNSKKRVSGIHKLYPKLLIAVDGGMDKKTIPTIIKAGAKRIIVGSDVEFSKNPTAEWKKLSALIDV